MIRPKTKAGLGRIVENWALGVGGAGCPILGGPKFFSTYSNGIFFLQGPGPGPPKPLRGSAPDSEFFF